MRCLRQEVLSTPISIHPANRAGTQIRSGEANCLGHHGTANGGVASPVHAAVRPGQGASNGNRPVGSHTGRRYEHDGQAISRRRSRRNTGESDLVRPRAMDGQAEQQQPCQIARNRISQRCGTSDQLRGAVAREIYILEGIAMCVETIDGVLVVREGTARLRWRHEPLGVPPLDPEQWLIGELWPNGAARSHVLNRIARCEPVLVVLDHESPVVVLPVENVPQIPSGTVIQSCEDDLVTMTIPPLNWLDTAERHRGQEFAASVRMLISKTPRFLLPPIITETMEASVRSPLKFVHTTGSNPYVRSLFPQVIKHLYASPRNQLMRPMAQSM